MRLRRGVPHQHRRNRVLNPKALPSFLEHQPSPLTEADVQLATDHLSRFIRASATWPQPPISSGSP